MIFCFVCFAKIPSMHTMTMFLRQQVNETLGVLVCNVLSFFMNFYLVLSHAICLIFGYHTNPSFTNHAYLKAIKCVKSKARLLQYYYREGDTSLDRGYCSK